MILSIEKTPEMFFLPRAIFMSRWLQAPLYVGLIVAQAIYVWQFWVELYVLLINVFSSKDMSCRSGPAAKK